MSSVLPASVACSSAFCAVALVRPDRDQELVQRHARVDGHGAARQLRHLLHLADARRRLVLQQLHQTLDPHGGGGGGLNAIDPEVAWLAWLEAGELQRFWCQAVFPPNYFNEGPVEWCPEL
jgi:hypothetical protein